MKAAVISHPGTNQVAVTFNRADQYSAHNDLPGTCFCEFTFSLALELAQELAEQGV